MRGMLAIYRKLDLVQRGRWFKVAAAIVALTICVVCFGSIIRTSSDIDAQRRALVQALAGQNLTEKDEHAVSLDATGTVTVNGRTYGGPMFLDPIQPLFDQSGQLIAPRVMTEQMLADQRPAWAPRWLLDQPGTAWMLAVITALWLVLIVAMEITLPFLLTLVGTALPVALCWVIGAERGALAFAGMGLLTFTFVLLTRAALILLQRPVQVLAVAHTVIKEASRTRISGFFIVALLATLPLVPLLLDPAAPLRFRIQTFISWSLGGTFIITAFMTLFLSCATVAFEIRDRQIWQLMTKPLGRFQYLLGKWLGVLTVNLILMVVAGVATFTFIQYLRTTPVAPGLAGQLDALQVRDEVLTARTGTQATYLELTEEQLRQRVQQRIERNPDIVPGGDVPRSTRMLMREEIEQEFLRGQRSIPMGQRRDYRFEGLGAARNLNSALTLRYRFYILRNDEHETFPAVFMVAGIPETAHRATYIPTMSHVLMFDPGFIAEDGSLTISVVNLHQQPPDARGNGAINFEADDFELLYRVSSFESNFLRAILIAWIKLAFLAAVGVCCSTFLSFPVALLTTFTIFIAGALGPFLGVALEEYVPPQTSEMDWGNIGLVIQWAFQNTIRLLAKLIVVALSAFGELRPTQQLVEGRVISWAAVTKGMLVLGALWSGLALLFGYLVFRGRQLAVYSGHG